jgi:hypothetical protein
MLSEQKLLQIFCANRHDKFGIITESQNWNRHPLSIPSLDMMCVPEYWVDVTIVKETIFNAARCMFWLHIN